MSVAAAAGVPAVASPPTASSFDPDGRSDMQQLANVGNGDENTVSVNRLGIAVPSIRKVVKDAQTTAAATVAPAITAAFQARDQSIAAAEASGPAKFFDTKAAAAAALGSLADQAIVEIFEDESLNGDNTRYQVVSAALVFKVNLTPANFIKGFDPMRFGALGDGSNDATALANTKVAAAGDTLYINHYFKIQSNVDLGNVYIGPKAMLDIGSNAVVQMHLLNDPAHQFLKTSASTTTARVAPVGFAKFYGYAVATGSVHTRPDWWGDVWGAVDSAGRALPAEGGTVKLFNRHYRPQGYSYGFGSDPGYYFDVPNVCFRGSGDPIPTNDMQDYVVGSGTFVQGMFLYYASNVKFFDMALGANFATLIAYYAEVITSGLTEGLIYGFPNDTIKNNTATVAPLGGQWHNVSAMVGNPTSPVHAAISGEGASGLRITGTFKTYWGIHGLVVKGSDVQWDSVETYLTGANGCIIKTDSQALTVAKNIRGKLLKCLANGPTGFSPYVLPPASSPSQYTYGLLLNPQGGPVGPVDIDYLITDGAGTGWAVAGPTDASYGGPYPASTIKIGLHQGINHPDAPYAQLGLSTNFLSCKEAFYQACGPIVFDGPASDVPRFDRIRTNGCALSLDVRNSSSPSIGSFEPQNGTTAMKLSSACRPSIEQYLPIAIVNKYDTSGVYPTLASGWQQVGGVESNWEVRQSGARMCFDGCVAPTGSSPTNLVMTLPFPLVPGQVKRCIAQGYDGTNQFAVPISINPAGQVYVNDADLSGSFANCTVRLNLEGLSYTL